MGCNFHLDALKCFFYIISNHLPDLFSNKATLYEMSDRFGWFQTERLETKLKNFVLLRCCIKIQKINFSIPHLVVHTLTVLWSLPYHQVHQPPCVSDASRQNHYNKDCETGTPGQLLCTVDNQFVSNFWPSWMLTVGELAQMVVRSLSMWEVPGSMPGFSKNYFLIMA